MQDQILERGFQKPLALFDKRRQYYDSIDMRVAAARAGDAWHNIRAKILLTCESIRYKSQVVPESDSFKIFREKLPIAQLTQVLTCMSNGELDIDKSKVTLWTSKDGQPTLTMKTIAAGAANLQCDSGAYRFRSTYSSYHDLTAFLTNWRT